MGNGRPVWVLAAPPFDRTMMANSNRPATVMAITLAAIIALVVLMVAATSKGIG